ncbi:sulfur carrier protein ThiS [Streptomyces jeddahensis]|uniref:Sulfur carrier protein ThiS n=1 Tax=Streptomyces jeddahensis TaxID=1716141 RepID=A0A177HXM1_9ACTN|nr:sulfur carrier protein ThiS [Streptomyces jeddahensis]OAH15613.1 sulfur carrier protein ThiS [Streptomyces jeddahensis]
MNRPATTSIRISVNGEPREVPAGTALGALVATLTTAPSGVAAALNETVVPRAEWPTTALTAGDRVEVLTAVQGG